MGFEVYKSDMCGSPRIHTEKLNMNRHLEEQSSSSNYARVLYIKEINN
jgi:hypothetical protein